MLRSSFPSDLKQGDIIRVISPAGPADKTKLASGIKRLKGWGYGVEIAPHALERRGFLAGNDADRLADLVDALMDPHVSGIFCSRGGYGVLRLLEFLPWDEIASQSSKPFIGFSDISAFQIVLWEKCGWISYSGPQVAMALGGDITERTAIHLRGMIDGSGRKLDWHDGVQVVLENVKSGEVEGVLLPCNLSMLVSLLGTDFFPKLKDVILCIEDVEEPPYRIDRMIWQLEKAGVFCGIAGLVLGAFTLKGVSLRNEVTTSVIDLLRGYDFPVWSNMPYGHVKNRLTLPVGAYISIKNDGTIKLS